MSSAEGQSVDKMRQMIYNLIRFYPEVRMKRFVAAVLMFALMILSFSSCSDGRRYVKTYYGDFFDTVTQIIVCGCSEKDAVALTGEIENDLEHYHGLFDIYGDHGEGTLKELNDLAGIRPVEVSAEMAEFLLWCKDMCILTNGKTNVMMGAVLCLWHDCRTDAENGNSHLPVDEALAIAGGHTDISLLEIDENALTAFISDAMASIDVGGVAKGYVCTKIAEKYENRGISFCLNLGGNVMLVGDFPTDDGKWSVGIKNPAEDVIPDIRLRLDGGYSVVTSGSYERAFEYDGVSYHHIIDSDTLYPKNDYLSVSVISRDSALCDALSTALFNMSVSDGMALCEKCGVHAVWIDSFLNVIKTADFEELCK